MASIGKALLPLKNSIKISAAFVVVLWAIWLLETLLGWSLHQYAILPRHSSGLVGIIAAPFLHGSAEHLAANSTGLLILGTALLYGYPQCRWRVLTVIWVIAGVGVWAVGRESYHLGASGITHGVFFFLLIASLMRRDLRSIGLMMVAFFMFGGMVYGVLPQDPNVSFESHLFGAVGGVMAALWFGRSQTVRPLRRWRKFNDDDDPTEGLWQQPPDDPELRQQYRWSQQERLDDD